MATDLRKTRLHATPELIRGIGVVCPPLTSKASQSSWAGRNRRTRTVGIAPNQINQVAKQSYLSYNLYDSTIEPTVVAITKTTTNHKRNVPASKKAVEEYNLNKVTPDMRRQHKLDLLTKSGNNSQVD